MLIGCKIKLTIGDDRLWHVCVWVVPIESSGKLLNHASVLCFLLSVAICFLTPSELLCEHFLSSEIDCSIATNFALAIASVFFAFSIASSCSCRSLSVSLRCPSSSGVNILLWAPGESSTKGPLNYTCSRKHFLDTKIYKENFFVLKAIANMRNLRKYKFFWLEFCEEPVGSHQPAIRHGK